MFLSECVLLDRPNGTPPPRSNFYIKKSWQMAPPFEWGPALFLCNSVLGSKIKWALISYIWDCSPLIPIFFSIFIIRLKRCRETADWLDSMWLFTCRANAIFQLCRSALTLRSGDTLTNERLETWNIVLHVNFWWFHWNQYVIALCSSITCSAGS